jgi:hypothetical protein
MGLDASTSKKLERARQYGLLADRLGLHLKQDGLPREVELYVEAARQALKNASAKLIIRPDGAQGQRGTLTMADTVQISAVSD